MAEAMHQSESGMTAADRAQPGRWLRRLAAMHDARWDVGHSIRAAITIGLPWVGGFAVDHVVSAMWISFGALMASSAERSGDVRGRLPVVIGATAIGAAGFLAGYLDGLPLAAIVLIMAALGGVAGVVAGFGAVLSLGTMQALLTASIAIGIPDIGPFWQPSLFYLAGLGFYALLFVIEAAFTGERSRKAIVDDLVSALADLAACRGGLLAGTTGTDSVEAARRVATARLDDLGSAMLRAARSSTSGGRAEADHLAAVLARCDAAFLSIMAAPEAAGLAAAAQRLRAPRERNAAIAAGNDALGAAIDQLAASLANPSDARGEPDSGRRSPAHRAASRPLADRLRPAPTAATDAAKLALCLGLAYSVRFVDGAEHWFWVPLTVSLLMKPDLGSVFARAALRIAGTVVGAAIGALILAVMPKTGWVGLPIAILAGLVPWAMQKSYALQAVVLTPLVLILVSALAPGPFNVDYGTQRIVDTAIGGVIVLVFGYFLWPKAKADIFAAAFAEARRQIAAYVIEPKLPERRRAAYRALAGMRRRLEPQLAEPPPASDEAAAWVPLVAAAERICDHVSIYATSTGTPTGPTGEGKALAALGAYIAMTPTARETLSAPDPGAGSAALAKLHGDVLAEIHHMDRLRAENARFMATA
ncbi:FUSC family protein [Kaistia geumhonensis]|uniref:Membrane protein YccC n=1 Tax=Kaistia geumhonensis TaxID=410839 RepID=A0ABU0M101_9HYPH|nr:FUSC family protein [Kaistia geumhonensis]MCX5480141.1 FUSC family protein [Kaistia geumhonensis]MDQ0514630.1 putative membrane protein YccC [Kaistia geumhonensis]